MVYLFVIPGRTRENDTGFRGTKSPITTTQSGNLPASLVFLCEGNNSGLLKANRGIMELLNISHDDVPEEVYKMFLLVRFVS